MRRRRGSSGMLGGLLLALPLLAGQAALVSGRTVQVRRRGVQTSLPVELLSSIKSPTRTRTQFALSADWPTWALSPLQETSEYLATEQEDGAAFWAFVDGLASDAPLSDTRRDVLDRAGTNATFDGHALVQVHPLALSQANAEAVGLHRVSQALLELYLGMGALTPTVELHRTLRKGACLWVVGCAGCDDEPRSHIRPSRAYSITKRRQAPPSTPPWPRPRRAAARTRPYPGCFSPRAHRRRARSCAPPTCSPSV